MPTSKVSAAASLFGQLSKLAQELDSAMRAHAELVASLGKSQALFSGGGDLAKQMDTATARLLKQAKLDPALKEAVADLRDISAAMSKQQLAMQTALQREAQVTTAVSNLLKAKHDSIRSTIGNIA